MLLSQQVGSHFHFIETNKRLVFDRLAAYGYRLVSILFLLVILVSSVNDILFKFHHMTLPLGVI